MTGTYYVLLSEGRRWKGQGNKSQQRKRGLTLLFGDPFHTEPGTGGELSTMNGSDDVRVLSPAWLVDCHTHIINIG